ncbi:MAG TPA: SDR family oxidoreductase [Terriglobales bacterium]|nr:SDR family oxidoreductase [Terriglobales bacterium]
MNIRFDNQVVVVTGGAMGIGEATAREFAASGASVAILDVNADAGQKTAAGIPRSRFYPCNVADPQQVEAIMEKVAEDFGGLHVLVSNAGIQRYGDAIGTSTDVWSEVMDTNLNGAFYASKFAVPHIIESGGGSIVVLGSVQTFTAIGGSTAYVTAKHGLFGLVRCLSLDFAKNNIRANCVCPGAIDTPMLRWAASLDQNPDKVIETCNRMHVLGRIGKPEEVANAIVFLASAQASFITGAALLVDGGMLVPTGGMGFQEGGTGAAAR